MSDPVNNPPGSLPPNPAAIAPGRRRAASVQLRDSGDGGADLATLMDPATKSLADALRITYRVLQLGMIVLVIVFVFSGVGTVQTNEKGVRLQSGRIESDDLAPGMHFTLPAPFGELVTIPAGVETVKLNDEFWPNLAAADKLKSPEELKNSPRGKLDPATDGSLITADGSLAHARVTVTFRRERVQQYLSSVESRDVAEAMVRVAVRRGVVHAAAGVTIDEFLSGRPDADRKDGVRDFAATVKTVAQRTLDEMQCGILLGDLSIQDPTPPIDVIKDFQKVSEEDAKAIQQREQATEEAAKIRAAAAGQNAGSILKLIDRYDQALTRRDDEAAKAELAKIDDLLDGKPVTVDGTELKGVGGKAAATLSAASEYRSSVVSRARADAGQFAVKLDSFRKNPSVMVAGEWTEAFRAFLAQKNVEVMSLPPGTSTIELLLNSDPTLRREMAIRKQQEAGQKKAEQDAKMMEDRKFNTERKPDTMSAN